MYHPSIFITAFVYLLAAVISVPLAKRFGLSSVLGYLVMGVAIGPFVLGLTGEGRTDVLHFAEFGVVLMLFLIGLELKPALLWKLRGPILGLGGAQVGLTTLAITAVAMLAGLGWQMALAIGMALSLSSTAIVLQSLQEKGLSKTTGGRSAFSVLLFQDIAVIPMLALFPLLATLGTTGTDSDHAEEPAGVIGAIQDWIAHQPAGIRTLLVIGAVAFIILAGRYLFQPVLTVVAKTRVRETFVALALLLVIGIAILMTLLGVSPALGTFLAGVLLANSEYRHALEADIEPFKGLLLGVFFISVGASIDFSLIASRPILIAELVAGLIVLKGLILFALGRFGRLAIDQRMLFSLSLAQGGEFAFVLLGFGITAGVVPGDLAQLIIAAVALTMGLTPLLLLFEEKVIRPRVGTRVEETREADSIDETNPVILVGIGRFGNFIARLLRAQKIGLTVIDNDSDHIDFLRQIGVKAYYGDACRHDLLEVAGAGEARLLIIALDSEEKINSLIHTAKKYFPNLSILVRAHSRLHQYALIEEGVNLAVHQYSESAIELARQAMIRLGMEEVRAGRMADKFRQHDRHAVQDLAGVHRDATLYVNRAREHLVEMERQFESDDAEAGEHHSSEVPKPSDH